jgi:hypothetical protein
VPAEEVRALVDEERTAFGLGFRGVFRCKPKTRRRPQKRRPASWSDWRSFQASPDVEVGVTSSGASTIRERALSVIEL